MQATDAAREVMRESGLTMMETATRMGRSPNYITSALARNSKKGGGFRTDTLAGIAKACGYALVLVPEDEVPVSAVIIDTSVKGV